MAVRAVDDDGGDSTRRRQEVSAPKAPSDRQEQILRAFAWAGNAAAVGRELKTNEGHVRRLARKFPDRLDELRRERDQERREHADAREARLQERVDPLLDAALARLKDLIPSAQDPVAVRAIKLAIDLAVRVPAPMSAPTELDRTLAEDERKTVRRIAQIEAELNEDGLDE